jgi:hypothetical protein
MPSPFPGMNPYLEHPSVWHDFHEAFCPALRDALTALVRPQYIVKIDEQVYLHELSAEERRLIGRPDVAIAETNRGGTALAATSALSAPAQGELFPSIDEERLSYLEVRDRDSRKLITVIELLSPTNKEPGSGHTQYLGKRESLILNGVNFVEIDLLRAGTRPPVKKLPACDYYVMIARPQDWPRVGLWPIMLRDRLPRIPIPLKPTDGDAVIDLQPLVEGIYDRAGYEDYIYTTPPEPAIEPSDSDWATELLATLSGRR